MIDDDPDPDDEQPARLCDRKPDGPDGYERDDDFHDRELERRMEG